MTKCKLAILFFTLLTYSHSFSQGKWTSVTKDSLGKKSTGILSETGKLLVPPKYEAVFGDGKFFLVKHNSLWGCYIDGKLFIPTEYESIGFRITGKFIRVKKGGKWGYVDFNNKLVVDFKYDFACNFINDKAYVQIGENGFHIDTNGKVLDTEKKNEKYCPEDLSEDTEYINQFRDGLLEVTKNNEKLGVVEKKSGKVIVPYEFDEINSYFNNIITVRKGTKWGAYTDKGVLICNPLFDSIGIFVGE